MRQLLKRRLLLGLRGTSLLLKTLKSGTLGAALPGRLLEFRYFRPPPSGAKDCSRESTKLESPAPPALVPVGPRFRATRSLLLPRTQAQCRHNLLVEFRTSEQSWLPPAQGRWRRTFHGTSASEKSFAPLAQ